MVGGLIDIDLDIEMSLGKGYHQAAAVSGHINGFSAHICNNNSKAMYTHCHRHRLNLAIGASFNIQCVRNVFDHIKEMSYFFKILSPNKRC